MANLLQCTDKSKSIDAKLEALISEVTSDYNNGLIKTETEYYYRLKHVIQDFYASLNKPTFVYRPAQFTPVSDDYNSMVNEAYSDMKYIVNDCKSLSNIVEQSFTDCELTREMMNYQVNYLSQQIDNLLDNLQYNQAEGAVIFTELFGKKNNQGNAGAEESCVIDKENTILMLNHQKCYNLKISDVIIDNDVSNGFPGNTHVVNTQNSEIVFEGQNSIHGNIENAYDNNLDTWFEFELFKIPDNVITETNGYGFDYKEGVSWIADDGPLTLRLIIKTDSSKSVSWFSIIPYLTDVKGIKPSTIKECVIITTDNNAYSLGNGQSFNGTKLFTFPAKPVKEIRVTLVQNTYYNTKVGHYYFTETNTKSMDIFQDYDTSESYARVEGEMPSVTMLGVKYDPSTQWIDYNNNEELETNVNLFKSKLFGRPKDTLTKKATLEMVDAYRYMIGIKSMAIRSYEFFEYGEYISNPYTVEKPIVSVMLEAEEYIPGEDTTNLKYYFTFDGGINWHEVMPINRAYAGVYKYTINNDSIFNNLGTRPKRSKNLNLIKDVYSVQVKIEMRRPKDVENNQYVSPIVYKYKLTIETGESAIEF